MKNLKFLVMLLGLMLAFFVVVAPTSQARVSYTVNNPSDSYPDCVMEVSTTQYTEGAICYSNLTDYHNDIDNYSNFVGTLYQNNNYTGWKLALVANSGFCNDAGVWFQSQSLSGTGWNNRVSSSKIYGSGCHVANGYDGEGFSNLMLNFGYDNNSGQVPDWSRYGAGDKLTSFFIDSKSP